MDALEPVRKIVIDVSAPLFWNISAVGALDRVVMKARCRSPEMEVVGLNAASSTMVERYGTPEPCLIVGILRQSRRNPAA